MIVTVYSTRQCPACIVLKKWLDTNKIEYNSIIVGEDISPQEFTDTTNSMGVPVTIVDGVQVDGFNQAELGKLLKL